MTRGELAAAMVDLVHIPIHSFLENNKPIRITLHSAVKPLLAGLSFMHVIDGEEALAAYTDRTGTPIDRLMNIAKVLGRKYLDEQADPELIQQFDEQFQHVIALMIQYGEEAESWEKEALQPPSAP